MHYFLLSWYQCWSLHFVFRPACLILTRRTSMDNALTHKRERACARLCVCVCVCVCGQRERERPWPVQFRTRRCRWCLCSRSPSSERPARASQADVVALHTSPLPWSYVPLSGTLWSYRAMPGRSGDKMHGGCRPMFLFDLLLKLLSNKRCGHIINKDTQSRPLHLYLGHLRTNRTFKIRLYGFEMHRQSFFINLQLIRRTLRPVLNDVFKNIHFKNFTVTHSLSNCKHISDSLLWYTVTNFQGYTNRRLIHCFYWQHFFFKHK